MRNIALLLLSAMSAISLKIFAGPERACEDLNRLTCAPGKFDDGTGSAQNSTYNNSVLNDLIDKMPIKAKTAYSNALKDPENTYFRKLALSATGLSLSPDCEGAEDSPSEKCLDALSEGVSHIAIRKLDRPERQSPFTFNSPYQPTIDDVAYLNESSVFKGVQDSLMRDLKKSVGSSENEQKIEKKIFPEIKKLLIAKLDKDVQDPKTKKMLIDKIKAITFDGSNCSKDLGGEYITGVTSVNASYHPIRNRFMYCAGFMAVNNSEFAIAHVIAHELSHSIDPCGITLGPSDFTLKYKANSTREEAQKQFPFANVISCLRGFDSVGALYKLPEAYAGYGYPYSGPVAPNSKVAHQIKQARTPLGPRMPPGPPYGGMGSNDGPPPPPFLGFCKDDQITEAFADWMANEITPEYIAANFKDLTPQQYKIGYSNFFRGTCNLSANELTEGDGGFEVHPLRERRINFLLLVQPKVREQMGCSSEELPLHIYCSGKETQSEFETTPAFYPGVNNYPGQNPTTPPPMPPARGTN